MAIRFVITIAIFQLAILGCYAVNGIIWHKQKQEFVKLFSIPQFAALQEENLAKHRAIEMQNMSGEVMKAVYYEVRTCDSADEKNMIMFYDNDTKVSGIYGNMWHLLADYLNFTFIPVRINEHKLGEKLENGTLNGMIGILARNEAQAIMRSGSFSVDRLEFVDYTVPLWKSPYHIYVRPEWQFDNTWILTSFSWQTWFFILFLFIILSFAGYCLQKVPIDKPKHKRKGFIDFNLGDHIFYSLAIMSTQDIPDAFYNKFKILSFSKSIFAWLILLAFSSHLIYHMTNREMMLPFKDVESLINNTKYILLAYRDSSLYKSLNKKYQGDPFARVRFIEIAEEMHSKICNNMKKYAMFETEDRFYAMNRNGCPLHATAKYHDTWISFALHKNFRYKRALDSALIKFKEVGLIDGLRDRWFNIRAEKGNTEQGLFKMIDFDQVYQIFLILCYGVLISLMTLVLEKITYYYYKTKNARQFRRR